MASVLASEGLSLNLMRIANIFERKMLKRGKINPLATHTTKPMKNRSFLSEA